MAPRFRVSLRLRLNTAALAFGGLSLGSFRFLARRPNTTGSEPLPCGPAMRRPLGADSISASAGRPDVHVWIILLPSSGLAPIVGADHVPLASHWLQESSRTSGA